MRRRKKEPFTEDAGTSELQFKTGATKATSRHFCRGHFRSMGRCETHGPFLPCFQGYTREAPHPPSSDNPPSNEYQQVSWPSEHGPPYPFNTLIHLVKVEVNAPGASTSIAFYRSWTKELSKLLQRGLPSKVRTVDPKVAVCLLVPKPTGKGTFKRQAGPNLLADPLLQISGLFSTCCEQTGFACGKHSSFSVNTQDACVFGAGPVGNGLPRNSDYCPPQCRHASAISICVFTPFEKHREA